MSATETSNVAKRALQELRYALIATFITLLAAAGLYSWAPTLRHYLQTKRERIGYVRKITIQNRKGSILYQSTGKETLESLRQDAELLKRRFERGEFRILTIAESTLKDAIRDMKANESAFRYAVVERDGGVALEIEARNPAAAKALRAYLTILKNTHDPEED